MKSFGKIYGSEINCHDWPFFLECRIIGVGVTRIGFLGKKRAIDSALVLSNIAGIGSVSVVDVINNIILWKNW